MPLHYPTSFAESTAPLPSNLGDQATEAAAQLAEHGFVVHAGLTPEYAGVISQIARQAAIREYCPKDATESRFGTPESAAQWLKKGDEKLRTYGRGMFVLLHQTAGEPEVAGYGWTGPEASDHVPGGQVTFAVRMNEAFQGMRAARPFTTLIVAGSAALYGAEGVWLEAWASNIRATSTYERAGFVRHPEATTSIDQRPSLRRGRVLPDARLYMSFPDRLLGR